MPLAPATRLGPYEILEPLGAGGMGEVYRGRDTRLGREVAVKVLPVHLSDNPEVRARFEREAKTISGLNHPNICTLFDVGREGDTDFLVMELVEGDTLAERLRRGPLVAAELLRFGTQIADALDRAHRAGVVHRDLKPGNIMITRSGAKLMDFGLARVTGLAGPAGDSGRTVAALTQSPTIAQALTAEGSLVGTFQYMSPEQLEGSEADARSDLWAFGCVLYEMATGRRAFEGRSQASLIAAILEREPPSLGEVPSGSGGAAAARSSGSGSRPPVSLPGLDRLIRACLVKDPEERMQTAHDAKLQLQWISESAGLSATSVAGAPLPAPEFAAARPRGARAWLPWGIAAAAVATTAAVLAWALPRISERPPVYRFRVNAVRGTTDTFWPRVSPDGRFLVLTGMDSAGVQRAYVRRMDQTEANPIPGTERLRRPYWSPDGREIVFVADDRIQRVPIGGGSPVIVAAASGGVDLSWGSKGQILMDGFFSDSLRVVPAGGGELRPASRIDRAAGEVGSAWPHFLPGGERFLFIGNTMGAGLSGNIRLGRLGSLDSKVLGKSDGRVEYSRGWVLYVKGATLLAQKLDLGAGKLTGQPITIVDDLAVGGSRGHFSVSPGGVVAFGRQGAGHQSQLLVVDRGGKPQGEPVLSGIITHPALSPDGRRLLYQRLNPSSGVGSEIYVFDLERRTDTRLTFTEERAETPAWSPDGRRFAYMLEPMSPNARLRVGAADGLGGQDSIPLGGAAGGTLTQWVESGSRLVVTSRGFNPFAIPTEGSARAAQRLLDSTQALGQPVISPDGRWLAGTFGTSLRADVFVQSLTGSPGRWQISTESGYWPRWSRNGRELLFESRDGSVMAVNIEAAETFRAGTPRRLFRLPQPSTSVQRVNWTSTADGERFFVVAPVGALRNEPNIEVVSDLESLVSRK